MKAVLLRRRILNWATPLFFCVCVGQAVASVTSYATKAAFDAATTGITTIGFEGIAPADGFVGLGNGGSLTLSGVTFTAHSGVYLFVNSSTYYAVNDPPAYDLGSGDYLLAGSGAPAFLSITLPAPVTALAFSLGTFDDSTSQITISLAPGGDALTAGAPYPTNTFVGFTSSAPISSLQIEITAGNRQDTLTLDNFSFGAAAIPEPNSITLLALGLGIVPWRQRKRRRPDV
ncbi:MAG TPA: hypothetical protein VL486_01745 [Verrucomicrobiae bacterium]|nr:hypothetical protein [Verrucomicrobiae bacterium]